MLQRFILGCGGRTRTYDLRVMSPASYQLLHPAILSAASLIRCIKKDLSCSIPWCRRPGSNRYGRNDHRILSPTCLPIPPRRQKMAPRVGLEPTTYRLTAGCSTIELSRRTKPRFFQRLDYYISDSYPSQGVRLIILSF